jgi:hypothetical protein
MLGLQIDGNNMYLGDDFSFTMNLKSSVFNDMGGYTYPFKIPNTPNNSRILGFRHRVESTTNVYGSGAGMFTWNGHPLFSGSLKMKILNDKSLEGALIDYTSDFYLKAKSIQLQQFDYGEMTFATEADAISYMEGTSHNVYPQVKFALPQLYNDLYFDPPTTVAGLKLYNNWHNAGYLQATLGGARTILIPMLYIRYVLDVIAAGMGYELKDELFTSHPDLMTLVLYNSLSCNNPFGTGTPIITHLVFNNHIPQLALMDFIVAIEKYFCAATFIDGIRNTIRIVPIKNILADESYIGFSKNILNISTEPEEQVKGFNLKMSVDGDDDEFGILLGFEEEIVKGLKGSVASLTDLPLWPLGQILDVYYVDDQDKYYQMEWDKTWHYDPLVNILMTRFYFRVPSESIETKLSSLLYYLVESMVVCGNKLTSYQAITPRIIFAKMVESIPDTAYDTFAANETDNFSLFYSWEKGLYEKFWRDFLQFKISTKLVKITKQMDFTELQSFDFSRKYMINGIKYLVKGIQVVLKKDTIMPAKLECYPCP